MRGVGIVLLAAVVLMGAADRATDILYENQADGSPILRLIASANQSIDIEIYTMKDPNVIQALKTAITDKHVTVRIIQTPEPVSDPCPVFGSDTEKTSADCKNLRSFVDFVKQNGGQYVPFSTSLCGSGSGPVQVQDSSEAEETNDISENSAKPKSCFQHGKILIVDGNTNNDTRVAMISTGNFDPSNLCDTSASPSVCNRDFTVTTTDTKIISTLEEIFSRDLAAETYNLQALLDETAVNGKDRLTASPHSLNPIVDFINSAQTSLQIENQYLEDSAMNDAIIAAGKRGVKVYVMVASASSFGRLSPTSDASKIKRWTDTFQAFDQANISSKIFDAGIRVGPKPGYLHAKVILVDGQHAWVGSVNGSAESLNENREFGIFSDDQTFVKHLSAVLYSDFTNPNAESWQDSLNCTKDACGGHSENSDDETPTPEKPGKPPVHHKPRPPSPFPKPPRH